jgi:Xaa-Pro aminopeptidase
MHVEWYNHVPLAKRIAKDVDVRWGEHRGIALTVEELKRRGAKRIGVIGPLANRKLKELLAGFEVVLLDADYVRLRLVKSEEEIEWLRIGAALSDAGFRALLEGTRPGLTERDLANLVERAYVGQGGTTFIHYIGVTSMADPQLCVPPQYASSRKVQNGDVVFCELSAYWWDYAGQVLRSFTVGADPTPLYQSLHDTAEAAFDAVTAVIRHGTTMEEILAAAGLIEERGFTIYDDLMHGFGGGYFPPIVGSRSRPAGPLPQMTLEENMTVVVQPNVITPDQKAGVQVGELVRVTRQGFESLHNAPRGFFRAAEHHGRMGFLPDSVV